MPSVKELGRWMTTGQVAEKLGRSRQGVLDLVEKKELRAFLVGKGYPGGKAIWIYDPDSVERFAREHKERRERKESNDG